MSSNLASAGAGERGRQGYTPWAIGPDSIGWLIVGASRQAAPRFVETVRRLPPLPNGAVAAYVNAIHSRSPWRASSFAAQHQIAFHSADLAEQLARPAVRAVYVANHPAHHAETMLAALRAGKHVLCEPPIAPTVEQAFFLHTSAADRGLVLGVNYQQRFDPAVLTLADLLARHELGDLLAITLHHHMPLPMAQQLWRTAPQSGGLLFERALRTFDAIRQLSRDEIAGVLALQGPPAHGLGVHDDLHAMFTLRRTGAVVHLHESWNAGRPLARIEVLASSGSAIIAGWNPLRTGSLFVEQTGPGARTAFSDADAGRPREPLPLPDVDLWLLSLLDVHRAITAGNPPIASAADDIAALDIAHAVLAGLEARAAITPSLLRPPEP